MSTLRKRLGVLLIPTLMVGGWLLLGLTGCVQTMAWSQFEREARAGDINTLPDKTYYCGSRDGYDYFYIEYYGLSHLLSSGKLCRVSSAETGRTNTFPDSTDRTKWQSVHDITLPIEGVKIENGQIVIPAGAIDFYASKPKMRDWQKQSQRGSAKLEASMREIKDLGVMFDWDGGGRGLSRQHEANSERPRRGSDGTPLRQART
jgi:hypothetical protein